MFTNSIRQWIKGLKDGEIILAKRAYEDNFSDIKEATFYQLLARLYVEGSIGKLAKGLYFKPYRVDALKSPTKFDLLQFFTNKNRNGIIVGEAMLVNKEIISIEDPKYVLYTNVLDIKSKREICGICIYDVECDFKNINIVRTIEVLEIIENIDKYSDINYDKLKEVLREFAVNFDSNALNKVLMKKSYKKRVIDGVRVILDYFNIENDLFRYLNSASKYEFPNNLKMCLN